MFKNFIALAFVLALSVSGIFLPISLANEASSLGTRELQRRECLRPTSSIDLHYIEEYTEDIPYVVRMRVSHDKSAYVAVEQFEHLLTGLTCSPLSHDNISTLTFAFDTVQSFYDARKAWSNRDDLLFVTHHTTCNDAETRAIYKSSSIAYDTKTITIVVTSRLVELENSPEAGSRLHIQGGILTTELRKKLRRRRNLEDHRQTVKRQAKNLWTINLQEIGGTFDKREEIISFDQLRLTCVDCALKGRVAVSYELDIDPSDILNPFNTAKIKMEIVEAIDGDFNIEAVASLFGNIQASFPGEFKGNYRQGKKFRPGQSRNGSTFGPINVSASTSLGVTVGLNWKASVNVTFPINVDAPAGRAISRDFFSQNGNSNNLEVVPKFGQPIINKDAITAQLCGFIGFGPAVTLEASYKSFKAMAAARLDMPRLELCTALAQNVDKSCAKGNFAQAVKLSATIGAGIVTNISTNVGLSSKQLVAPPPSLYQKWSLGEVCFDLNGNDRGVPTLPNIPKVGDQPTDPGFGIPTNNGTTSGSNSPGAYDCAGIAPSPGGQPCGNVIMQCLDASRWSCGNGQQGIVPPGTFCACGAFRYPGWKPPTAASPTCTTGITCVSETLFSICSPAGIEPPQAVSLGTKCRNSAIVAG